MELEKITFRISGGDPLTFKELIKLIIKTALTEDFSSKRFIGDSDWLYCIAMPLIENNLVKGKIITDENGDKDLKVDWEDFNLFVKKQLEKYLG